MGLVDQAKQDLQDITSNLDGWGVSMTLTAPTLETATIVGLHTKHHLNIDEYGSPIIGKNAHASFSEQLLIDASYPVRNANNEVDLNGHLLDVADSTGNVKNYIIKYRMPDETLGFISCILEDYE